MTKLKWILIGAAAILVMGVAWWIAGKAGLVAGGGILALIGLGRRKAPSVDALKQALDDGLDAKESQVESEREEMKQQAADDTAEDAHDLEERSNAIDPDSVPWRRRRRDD